MARKAENSVGSDRNGGMAQLVVAVVFATFAVLAVGLRVISRRLSRVHLRVNDYMIIFALLSTLCGIGAIITSVIGGGAGQHQELLSDQQVVTYWKAIFVLVLTWPITQTAIKISILQFYLQLFVTKQFRIAAYITMFVVCLWCVEQVLATLLICKPISYNWDFTTQKGSCANTTVNCIVGAGINIVTDLVILLLPMPTIWRLKIPTRSKISLSLIFGLGFIICIISCVRLSGLVFWNMEDGTYVNTMAVLWTSLESTLGIICACIVVMRPLFGKAFPDRFKIGEKIKKLSSDPSSASGSRLSRTMGWIPPKSQARGRSGNGAESHDRLFSLSLGGGQTQATNTTTIGVGSRDGAGSGLVDIEAQSPKRSLSPGAIMVKREWEVDSLVI